MVNDHLKIELKIFIEKIDKDLNTMLQENVTHQKKNTQKTIS